MERKDKADKIEKIIIKRIVVGTLETNCYFVADGKTREAVIIDPGDEPEKIFNAIKENGLKPQFILLTHEHSDHTDALKALKIMLSALSGVELRTPKDRDEIKTGNLIVKVVATPGHTPESVCYIIKNIADDGAGIIFSGDTLFKRGIGRTDLEGGDYNEIKKSLKRLMEFPDHFRVFPGHGEETTIEEERKTNPFQYFNKKQ